MERITVAVPGSTSNLGSGFDTLGLAVSLWLTVEAERVATPGLLVAPDSTNAASAEAMVREACEPWLKQGLGMRLRIRNEIPVGRGLGASAALRVASICAASALAGERLRNEELLAKGYALEHHPDNVSPSIYGGFTVSGKIGDEIRCQRFEVDPALRLVTLLPSFEMPTGEARKLLPESYSRADAAHALNRAALVTAAFATNDYAALAGAFDDCLHQPYREKLLPELTRVIRAGEKAGAIGGFLSGAGSGIICLTRERELEVGRAMLEAFPNGQVRILSPENRGITVREQ